MQLWQLRYGHLGHENLKLLNDKTMVDGMEVTAKCNTYQSCEACAMGKQHREAFPRKSECTTTELLELIHSNVCGPINVKSLGGARLFVTFMDDYSRYTTVHILKSKDEVFSKFKDFVAFAENQAGRSVKGLPSDNGGEYTSKDFNEYFRNHGIRREFTIPYSRKTERPSRKNESDDYGISHINVRLVREFLGRSRFHCSECEKHQGIRM